MDTKHDAAICPLILCPQHHRDRYRNTQQNTLVRIQYQFAESRFAAAQGGIDSYLERVAYFRHAGGCNHQPLLCIQQGQAGALVLWQVGGYFLLFLRRSESVAGCTGQQQVTQVAQLGRFNDRVCAFISLLCQFPEIEL